MNSLFHSPTQIYLFIYATHKNICRSTQFSFCHFQYTTSVKISIELKTTHSIDPSMLIDESRQNIRFGKKSWRKELHILYTPTFFARKFQECYTTFQYHKWFKVAAKFLIFFLDSTNFLKFIQSNDQREIFVMISNICTHHEQEHAHEHTKTDFLLATAKRNDLFFI